MASTRRRDLQVERAKFFSGDPAERVETVLWLGEQALDLYLASLPRGTSRCEARARMQRHARFGRRRSAQATGGGR
jgi:hypothetical protein